MKIALVYDLRTEYLAQGYSAEQVAEFDSIETVDALAASLTRLGYGPERIGNGRALARALADGRRFDLVLSIAEGLAGRSREAQVASLCEMYAQPYVFSDPLTLAVALDKGAAKCLVRDAGVPTAPFVTVAPDREPPLLPFDYPVFVKPLAEGTGKGCEVSSVCRDAEDYVRAVAALTARFAQPVIVEPFLSGREFTVGIVGTGETARVIGIVEIVLNAGADAEVYSYRNKEECESFVTYRKATDEVGLRAGEVALAAYRALGCRDGGRLDLRCDAGGQPQFLEANPLAGLNPQHSDLPIAATLHGMCYDALIAAIVASACARNGVDAKRPRRPPTTRAFVPVMHAASAERADEIDTCAAAEAVAGALEARGYATEIMHFTPETSAIERLADTRPTAVFNLVEAIDGRSEAACVAAWHFERAGLAYTGCPFAALVTTASKVAVKGLLSANGIATPVLGESASGRVIVKPMWEHASLGIDAQSVVSATEARRLIALRQARFGTPFFAEAYIEGREFNLAVFEDAQGVRVLPIPEIEFIDWPQDEPRIVDFAAKWLPDSARYRNTPRRFGLEDREPALAAVLAKLALEVWARCGLRG
jgi:D-alanine-D-alanine ligase